MTNGTEKERIRRRILSNGDKTVLIQSYRERNFSHYQIADLFMTTTKTVYEHLKKPKCSHELSDEDFDDAVSVVGKPLGFKAGGERPKRTICLDGIEK